MPGTVGIVFVGGFGVLVAVGGFGGVAVVGLMTGATVGRLASQVGVHSGLDGAGDAVMPGVSLNVGILTVLPSFGDPVHPDKAKTATTPQATAPSVFAGTVMFVVSRNSL